MTPLWLPRSFYLPSLLLVAIGNDGANCNAWTIESRRDVHVLANMVSASNDGSNAWTTPYLSATESRRDVLANMASASLPIALAGVGGFLQPEAALAYTPDSDKLRESLYLMSRVQESTVQLERLIKNAKTQDELKPKLKLKLKLVQASYRLQDQINYASQFVDPPEELVAATEAGNIAVSSLQDAVVFVRDELPGTGPITTDQREFMNEALQSTRDALFTFLDYMPKEKLEAARKRVEVENVDNREEFDSDLAYDKTAGIYNPVKLPWKK